MGGNQIPGMGTGDDGYDEEGYDESQRAEILEATRNGPSDGLILTDLDPDLGEDDEDEPIDELDMEDGEVGEEAGDVDMDEDDQDEDDAQEAFEDGRIGLDANGDPTDDEDISDTDDVAIRP